MSAISIILIVIVALLAGMEGILDQFQFHQPIVACTLIGLVSGHLKEGIMLGGAASLIIDLRSSSSLTLSLTTIILEGFVAFVHPVATCP